MIAPTGVSIISDIDDTIKISNVKDKQELLTNTFLRPFRAVPGMVELYQQWARQGAVFHYLSASPWQLYPALSEFIVESAFPAGSFHLNDIRLKDETFFNLFSSQETYKKPLVEQILKAYPGRRFFLIGDAGEEDPEIFSAVAKSYPDQVLRVVIRDEAPNAASSERYQTLFQGIPRSRWSIFRDGSDLSTIDIAEQSDNHAHCATHNCPDDFIRLYLVWTPPGRTRPLQLQRGNCSIGQRTDAVESGPAQIPGCAGLSGGWLGSDPVRLFRQRGNQRSRGNRRGRRR